MIEELSYPPEKREELIKRNMYRCAVCLRGPKGVAIFHPIQGYYITVIARQPYRIYVDKVEQLIEPGVTLFKCIDTETKKDVWLCEEHLGANKRKNKPAKMDGRLTVD